jgi:hypothetical protein
MSRTLEDHRSYMKQWKTRNPERQKELEKGVRERRKADPVRMAKYREYQRKYQRMLREKYADRLRDKRRAKYHENAEKLLQRVRDENARVKKEVFAHYGNKCACCGIDEMVFLTMDHIYGDGAAHRGRGVKRVGSGTALYRWLRRHNYPDGFQVLCFNCNCAKRTNLFCPHQMQLQAMSA